jgi:hypothetical protein
MQKQGAPASVISQVGGGGRRPFYNNMFFYFGVPQRQQ